MQALESEALCYRLNLACLHAECCGLQTARQSSGLHSRLQSHNLLSCLPSLHLYEHLPSAASYRRHLQIILILATIPYLVSAVCFCSARCSSALLTQPRAPAGAMALDIRIAGRYRLGRKIGSGSFGDIYLGRQGICTADVLVSVMLAGQEGRKAEVCDRTLMRGAWCCRHPHPHRRGGWHQVGEVVCLCSLELCMLSLSTFNLRAAGVNKV